MDRNSILTGNSRQYISVTDCDKLEMIAKLLPFYKSFNRLANDALAYGLPKLIEDKLGEKNLNDVLNEQPTEKSVVPISEENISEKFIGEVVPLLQEIVMNTNMGKSLLCSLFNAKCEELKGTKLMSKFKSGGFRDTPDYLAKYEIEMLNEMDEDE